jgi:hypothetical protein
MKAREVIGTAAYDSEERDVILRAFEDAWAEIEHHFHDCPRSIMAARVWLADEILAAADQSSRDAQMLKSLGLQAMAMHYGRNISEGMMGQRVHNARYWRSYADETLAIADQMTDPECRRLLLGVAETYAQLARHAAASEAAKRNRMSEIGKS